VIIGYARVSTDGQTLDAQQAALAAAGAQRVFAEKVSGAVTDRKALGRALAALGAGDVLLVTRLDRVARSTRDLLNVLDAVAKADAAFRSLTGPWADTSTPHGSAYRDGPRRPRTIREDFDLGQDQRRPRQGQGSWGAVWPQKQAHRAPTKRGVSP
jgi:hypothetical protein